MSNSSGYIVICCNCIHVLHSLPEEEAARENPFANQNPNVPEAENEAHLAALLEAMVTTMRQNQSRNTTPQAATNRESQPAGQPQLINNSQLGDTSASDSTSTSIAIAAAAPGPSSSDAADGRLTSVTATSATAAENSGAALEQLIRRLPERRFISSGDETVVRPRGAEDCSCGICGAAFVDGDQVNVPICRHGALGLKS